MNEQWFRSSLKLYLIMGSMNCSGRDPIEVLEEALRGGITMFQYREKGINALQGAAAAELGMKLRALCRKSGVPFIVNDDVQLMRELDADGIHVGQEDLHAAVVRSMVGSRLVGVSAHDEEEARQALACGADYLGVGPMFPTSTKPDALAVRGPAMIRRLRNAGIAAPVVGIGGINEANARAVMEAGADGVAVISAIAGRSQAYTAAAGLMDALNAGNGI